MYKDFYQLDQFPFNITADPSFFYSSAKHLEAISHLAYGIQERKGIIVITGEIGTGKTTLCRSLVNRLDEKTKCALVLNPNFSDVQLLKIILKDLGIETTAKNKFDLINTLNEFLLKESSRGNNTVVIIDEAQNLSVRQLEQIRLLSNLETEKDKLLQLVLVGQPELAEKLKLSSLRQLNQRVGVRYHLTPLNRQEVDEYIHHRLKLANGSTPKNKEIQFTNEAITAIYNYSIGTPRKINVLCDRALLAGYTAGSHTIDQKIIHRCIQEVDQT